MLTIGVILGMTMLTFFFSGVEEDQRNPNSSPQSMVQSATVEVPLKRNRQGHYMVTGAINQQPVDFLLDTGATDVVIPERTAKRLGLTYGRRSKAMTASWTVTAVGAEDGSCHDSTVFGESIRRVPAPTSTAF